MAVQIAELWIWLPFKEFELNWQHPTGSWTDRKENLLKEFQCRSCIQRSPQRRMVMGKKYEKGGKKVSWYFYYIKTFKMPRDTYWDKYCVPLKNSALPLKNIKMVFFPPVSYNFFCEQMQTYCNIFFFSPISYFSITIMTYQLNWFFYYFKHKWHFIYLSKLKFNSRNWIGI